MTPSYGILNLTVSIIECNLRIARVVEWGKRWRLVRWMLQYEWARRIATWWCARPAMDRRNWKVG